MLVHLLVRPHTSVSHLPRAEIRYLSSALRASGVDVIDDAWAVPSTGMSAAAHVMSIAVDLRARWAIQRPDVVYTIGLLATMGAVEAGCGAPIVATFDERPANQPAELALAQRVAAVMPLSRAERDRWRRHGVRTLSVGSFPLPAPKPVVAARAVAGGDVICLSGDGSLDALILSMPMWVPIRLVIGARLSPTRLAGLHKVGTALGVWDRVDYRPGLRGEEREAMWRGASVLVAGVDGSRHGGQVVEAAAHGVPSIAVAQDAHLDHVVHATSGILVDRAADARGLGCAVASLVFDSFGLRAMGTSALVRAHAVHSPELAGQRLLAMLAEVCEPLAGTPGPIPPSQAATTGCLDQCSCASGITCDRAASRNALVTDHLPLARQLARWYAGRGQSTEDLVQVASLGLVRAADRFDTSYGKEFHSFAIPTILGELRRHFRDNAWAVRVPRTLQETTLNVHRANDELHRTLGREATLADLAQELGLAEEEIRLAVRTDGEARSSKSLDHPVGDRGTTADMVGAVDRELDFVELRGDVQGLLRQLPEREQQVLLMRFYGECTQSEIAERLGMSQVHVSRILSRTLTALRDHVLHDEPLPAAWHVPEPAIPTPRRAS
jgi:RNA polymerase sigma-B factor